MFAAVDPYAMAAGCFGMICFFAGLGVGSFVTAKAIEKLSQIDIGETPEDSSQ